MIGSDDRIEKVRRFLDDQSVLRDRCGEIFCGQAAILLGGPVRLGFCWFQRSVGARTVVNERSAGPDFARSTVELFVPLPGLPAFSLLAAFWNGFRINAKGKDFFWGRFYFRGDPECTMIARRFFYFWASS